MPPVSKAGEDAMPEQPDIDLTYLGRSSLRGDFLWTLIGNGVYAASQWVVIVLLAKWSRPEIVGAYSFAIAVATPLITFASFQLRAAQVTDVRGEHHFSDYLGFRLLSMAVAMVVLTALCFGLHYSSSRTGLVEAVGLSLMVEAVSDVYYGRMQAHNRMDSIAKSMIVRGVLSSLALVAVMILTASILLGVLAMTFVRVLVLLFFDARVRFTLYPVPVRPVDVATRPRWALLTQKTLLKTTLPLGLVSVLVALNTSIPRYFIEWSSGSRELGIFAALCFFQSSGNMVVGAMGQAAFGRLAVSYARHDMRGFFPLVLRLLVIGGALGVTGVLVAVFAGRQILELLFRHEYAARADLLIYLMVAAGLGYCCQFIGSAVTAARIFRPQIALFLIVASSLTGFCYLFVPGHGAGGAITAIVGSTLVQISGFTFILLASARRRRKSHGAFFKSADGLAVSGFPT
jgi:O-antigen/teichoic acid export membrane protein